MPERQPAQPRQFSDGRGWRIASAVFMAMVAIVFLIDLVVLGWAFFLGAAMVGLFCIAWSVGEWR